LVSMRVPEEQVDEAVEIMKRHHAVNIDERVALVFLATPASDPTEEKLKKAA
jgi:hypothetical protein